MPSSRRPERCWAALALLALAACTRPIPPLPTAPSADPLATLRARMAAVQTLRARFTAAFSDAGEQRRATGVLIARRPDALRLRLFAPFGLTLLDYLRRDGEVFVWLPQASGDAAQTAAAELLNQLVVDDTQDVGDCADDETPEPLDYLCSLPDGRRRLLKFAATGELAIAVDLTIHDGRVVAALTRTYFDHRIVEGVPLPLHIEIKSDKRDTLTILAIDVDRWEVNPTLPADAFKPVDGAVLLAPAAALRVRPEGPQLRGVPAPPGGA